MGLFSLMGASTEEKFIPYMNTDYLFDLTTGIYVPGGDNNMILNGGLGHMSGVSGRPNRHKTTILLGHILSAMSIYPDSDLDALDTESTLGKARVISLVPDPSRATEFSSRIRMSDRNDYDAESYFAYIQTIVQEKLKHAKDLTVETPFIDPITGKYQTMLIPTFILIDSWTEFKSRKTEEAFIGKDISDPSNNMVDMMDGKVKKHVMSQFSSMAAKANLRFCMTAHIGDKYEMNQYQPSSRDHAYMKSNEKIKGTGSNFGFLVTSILEIRSIEALTIDKKESRYPDGITSAEDVVSLATFSTRNKNGSSGGPSIDIISSQAQGLQKGLTDFNVLKDHKDYGLTGNAVTQRTLLSPDVSFTRKTVRDKLKEHRFHRGVQLLAQLCWIQNRWTLNNEMSDLFNITPEKFAESIVASKSIKMDDILESRGYWTYDKNNKRKYMSIIDVLKILKKG